MRKENSAIRTKFISEAGSQLINADYFAFVELDNYACYCIADGIDNDRTKESAKLAVSTVIDEFYQRPGMGKGLMKHYLEKAHQTLLRESGTFRLEASVLVVITDYKKVRYANAGNTRMYHWRNGKIINQSKDQSLSQNLAERGDLALDKIEEHEERHNLYCYAGQRGSFKPYVSKKTKMFDGDSISLMTCGIWENTGIAELLDAIEDAKGPEDVCMSMEEIILSQRLRNIQNYTFACVYIDKVYLNPNKQRNQKLIKKIVIPIAIVLFMLLIAFIISKVMLYRKIGSLWNNIEVAVEDMAVGMDEEGNSNYDKAKNIYDEFDSKSELSNKRVIEAKYYLNLLKYREDYVNGETCYDRYVSACKILTCLVGKKGFERVENDGLDSKILSLSALHKIDKDYLDKSARDDLENFKESFLEEYEVVKAEYKIYMLMDKAKKEFEANINDSSNDRDLIDDAKAYGIIIYNFDGTDFENVYKDLKTAIALAKSENIDLDTTLEEYNEFLSVVNSRLSYIKAMSYKSEAEKLVKNGQYEEARIAYNNAIDALEHAGADTYAGDISDLEGMMESVSQRISDEQADTLNEETRTMVSNADTKFKAGKYDDAYEICKEVSEKLAQNGISSGIVYDDLVVLRERIDNAQKGEKYEKEALGYENEADYDMAYSTYEYAQKSYKEAGVDEKEAEMRKKLNEISKLIKQMEENETENSNK